MKIDEDDEDGEDDEDDEYGEDGEDEKDEDGDGYEGCLLKQNRLYMTSGFPRLATKIRR